MAKGKNGKPKYGEAPKSILFCHEYIKDLNGKRAAIAVGYSEKGASVCATKLLKQPDVRSLIQALMDKRSKRMDITADRVLEEIARSAFFDIGDLYNESGAIKPLHEIESQARRAIASIESQELFEGFGKDRIQTGHTKKLKLNDKLKALELLGRHLKLFTDKVEHVSNKPFILELIDGKKIVMGTGKPEIEEE